jgi:hypothetical protein
MVRIKIPFRLRSRERTPERSEEPKDERSEVYGDYGAAMGRFIGSRGYWSTEHLRAFFAAKAALSERRRSPEERL